MSHATEDCVVTRLTPHGMIVNMHSVMCIIRSNMKDKYKRFKSYERRQKSIEEIQSIYPDLSPAAAENLLDGFYCVTDDGSILVDDVAWGRR